MAPSGMQSPPPKTLPDELARAPGPIHHSRYGRRHQRGDHPRWAAQGEDLELPFYFSTDGLGGYVDVVPDICTCVNVDGDYLCDDEDPVSPFLGIAMMPSVAPIHFHGILTQRPTSTMVHQDNACGIDGTLIVASSYSFEPASITIPVGGKVVWQAEGTSSYDVNGSVSSITGEPFGNPEAFSILRAGKQ